MGFQHYLILMAERAFHNVYGLSEQQLEELDAAEEMMENQHLNEAEELLLRMYSDSPGCIPVLNNLGVLYGKYLLEYDSAIMYYEKVLEIEPDNAWARNERRRYQRYITYD